MNNSLWQDPRQILVDKLRTAYLSGHGSSGGKMKSLGHYLRKGHKLVKKHKLISRGLKKVKHPLGNIAAELAQYYGYGVSGGAKGNTKAAYEAKMRAHKEKEATKIMKEMMKMDDGPKSQLLLEYKPTFGPMEKSIIMKPKKKRAYKPLTLAQKDSRRLNRCVKLYPGHSMDVYNRDFRKKCYTDLKHKRLFKGRKPSLFPRKISAKSVNALGKYNDILRRVKMEYPDATIEDQRAKASQRYKTGKMKAKEATGSSLDDYYGSSLDDYYG